MLRHSCLKLLTAPACSLQAGLDRGIEVEISAEQRATEEKKKYSYDTSTRALMVLL